VFDLCGFGCYHRAVAIVENNQRIENFDDLLALFRDGEKPVDKFHIGAEMEKFGVREDGSPIQYEGPDGVSALMTSLVPQGWTPESEVPGGPMLALLRDGASITLEPGSQFELSGAQMRDVHAIDAEARAHMQLLTSFSRAHKITWLGTGFHPFSKRADYTFVPKQRYRVMREYLPTRGGHALDMMLRTGTVQANFDFSSEADAMQKLRVGLRLAPLTAAMFANSPFVEGKPFGGKSFRARVWLDVDPDRSGLVPRMLEKGRSYADYVEWVLDAPMFMIKRGVDAINNSGQRFRDFWKNGFEGHHATLGDWQTHVNTMFPEVRLKRTLEIRSADSQRLDLAAALSALWTGIYYDQTALDAAEALGADFTAEELSELRNHVWKDGLAAQFRGKPLAVVAEQLIEIAQAGLLRRGRKNAAGQDETVVLAPLSSLVARGMTPADAALEQLGGSTDVASIVRAFELPTA
jgi:glutamate--cysteine ligase